MDPIKLIAERRKKLEAERGQLLTRMAEIDKDIADQDTALRVLSSLVPAATGEGAAAPSPPANGVHATPGTVKDLVLEILRGASPQGMKAGEIRDVAKEDYGVDINSNTLTVTLGRFKTDGKVRIRMRKWFFVVPPRERTRPTLFEVAESNSEGENSATSTSRPALPTGEPHSGHVKPSPGGGT